MIVHESWWTPTARHADIVLPATTTLERNDVGGSSRDRFVFAMHRAIDPVGEARNDFDIFRALAGRLGYESAFTEGRDEMGWCQWVYDRMRASGDRPRAWRCRASSSSGRRASSSCRRPSAISCCSRISAAIPSAIRSKTPSGQHRDRLRRRSRASATPTARRIRPGCRRRNGSAASAAQRWPLHLVTHQPAAGCTARWIRARSRARSKVAGREPIRLNPADAARRGIADGDVVRVFNARGACLAGAVIDAGVMPGVVVMATGAWFDPSRWRSDASEPERHGNPNVLTLDIGTSPLAQGPSALTALVEIERWNAPARRRCAPSRRRCWPRLDRRSATVYGSESIANARVANGDIGDRKLSDSAIRHSLFANIAWRPACRRSC